MRKRSNSMYDLTKISRKSDKTSARSGTNNEQKAVTGKVDEKEF